MLIGACEGQSWRYEVIESAEGFLVRMRDLDSGSLEDREARMFRTAAVAFAFADMSAAFERCAQALVAGEDADALAVELGATQTLYEDISRRLGDDGVAAQMLAAWERDAEAADRRRYH